MRLRPGPRQQTHTHTHRQTHYKQHKHMMTELVNNMHSPIFTHTHTHACYKRSGRKLNIAIELFVCDDGPGSHEAVPTDLLRNSQIYTPTYTQTCKYTHTHTHTCKFPHVQILTQKNKHKQSITITHSQNQREHDEGQILSCLRLKHKKIV